ncbi:MAG TPA: hypothetical protein VFR00_07810 [Hyphomicrobiaceae bacterium]|jgi:hypothetical protein|nr:hypothetical protein [Hyphomicrobiaceae bacterium]
MQSTKLAMIAALGLASMGLGTLAAAAAPTAPGPAAVTAGTDGKAESIAYRRCWWQGGHRHCRWFGPADRGYGYGYRYYGPLYPEAYRTGTRRWWQEMDRDDRGGRGRP